MARLSVVTPSFNQAEFLFWNLSSIASSGHDVEHIVLDGGSNDGSAELLASFDRHLAYWVSEKDNGQYDAINRGLQRSTGEIMAWLNSDDMYFPWTIGTVLQIFDLFPEIEWLTTRHPTAIDSRGHMIKLNSTFGFEQKSFLAGFNLPGAEWEADVYIQQESTFWRRALWDRAGAYVDTSYRFAGDFDLWARFFTKAKLYSVDVPLGTFRRHDDQKTSVAFGGYVEEAKSCLLAYAGSLPDLEVMPWRLGARRDPGAKAGLIKLGLADWAPIVTYDWGAKRWVLGNN
jgi:glycosyltransferase involved in cell wall biosynthesis